MLKKIPIILFGLVLLVTFGQCRRLSNDNKDETKYEEELARAVQIHKKSVPEYRELFDLNHLLNRFSGSFSNSQRTFHQQMLDAHNKYRKRHCVGPLQLDDNLSRSAQNYAERLVSIGYLVHSHINGVGENLYWSWSSSGISNINGE